MGPNYQMMIPLTPMVKKILIVTVGVWIIGQIILEKFLGIPIISIFALIPKKTIYDFFIWQPFSYFLLHSYEIFHILFNMLILWWLGADLEQKWGSKFFLLYYVVCGAGAGIIYALSIWVYTLVTNEFQIMYYPVIGASGAVFGLMLAFGIYFGDRIIYFLMLFPMKAKYFVMILGGIEVINILNTGPAGGQVANLAHLGGLITGYVFLKLWTLSYYQNWNKKKERKRSKLKLVVDKDKNNKGNGPPKYWN